MNIDLLQRVKAAILAEPESFDMRSYANKSPCGTTACIAGHAVTIARKLASPMMIYDICRAENRAESGLAKGHLEITEKQSFDLFHESRWPSEFANRYRRNKTARGRAKVAAERIDYFIETGK